MYDETLDDFVLEMEERIPNIEKYKEESDMENYAILVHALKGDSKYLGFTKLADLAYNHQIKSQEGNVDYVNEHYDELMNEVNRVMSVINEYKNM
jgi:HPt (histidine-containing phosphotransfer) domain-containing protein